MKRPLAAPKKVFLSTPRDEVEQFYCRGNIFRWNRPPHPIWRATDAKAKIGRPVEWIERRPLRLVAEINAGLRRETRS